MTKMTALGLKISSRILLNELMKLIGYQRSSSFFDLRKRSLKLQNSNLFLSDAVVLEY